MKLANMHGSKPCAARLVGSTPTSPIAMINAFIERLAARQKKPQPAWVRKAIIVLLPPLFLAFIFSPGYFLGPRVDAALNLPRIATPPLNSFTGGLIFLIGFVLYAWTILLFARIGQGTQTPIVPTQRLVTTGPYAHSRNPMFLGAILMIIGFGIILNSIAAIVLGLIIPISYLIVIKLVEEKELEARFGQEYAEYKKRVPFLIPTLWRKIQ